MDAERKVKAYIDEHLFEPLSVTELAGAAGLSPFHFSRLFAALQGESVMAYVRRRRLQAAAERLLADPDARLIDLAFDCAFESQEAFTRAFKRAFGVSPGRFRRGGCSFIQGDPSMVPSIDLDAALTVSPEPVRRGPFRVAGLGGRFDGDTRPQIPHLWERFLERLPLEGQVGRDSYGLCWSASPEEPFTYMAAVEIAPDAPEPDGLETLVVPGQAYLVFRQAIGAGPLQPQMLAAIREIWGRRLPSSGRKPTGGPDFEFYPGEVDHRHLGPDAWLAYYVPVEP